MKKNGFTLVEISIVIIIVGLLLGGIMQGTHLIRSAKLKSLSEQVSQIRSAFNIFKQKYGSLPGDMATATDVWGAADGGDGLGADCTAVDSTNLTTTCNGDGDGRIIYGNYNAFAIAQTYESFRAFQQMGLAGLLPGQYSGVNFTPSSTAREAAPGINVPAAKFPDVGFTLFWYPSGTATWFPGTDQHVIIVGGRTVQETRNPFLSAAELESIDRKEDDGKPGTGFIRTWRTMVLPLCASTDDPVTSIYQSTTTGREDQCAYYYMIGN